MRLVALAGKREVFGFRQEVMGKVWRRKALPTPRLTSKRVRKRIGSCDLWKSPWSTTSRSDRHQQRPDHSAHELRKALDVAAGDGRSPVPGRVDPLEARKRRRIVDFARANAFRAGEAGIDLDKTIDEAITLAMEERERRSRGG